MDKPSTIASDILDIVQICHSYGVNNVYVSTITYRPQHLQSVSETNNFLRTKQLLNDFIIIDNDNIKGEHIWKDEVHLNNNGTIALANNLIKAINRKHVAWHASSCSNDETNEILIDDSFENDPRSSLKDLKLKNSKRLVIGHININSIRNKFEALKEIVNDNVDILMISETKLDDSFPIYQFQNFYFLKSHRV